MDKVDFNNVDTIYLLYYRLPEYYVLPKFHLCLKISYTKYLALV